ncbi:MAG: aminotransferase class I/II-fold pyridoxal phosphate-dependent enzyme [Anaerolineae bacterium]|nr:aminotransferase class I/II-fold pyridoxal phosphate-dependent enzyme [Anaerolineae bacterium]
MRIPPFKLERYFARYEFAVDYVLCSSDCESLSIGDLLAFEPDAGERFQQHWLGYTESQGSPSLQREISTLYTTIAPDQILVHTGAEEAIFLFMHAALDAGDHVIVQWPCYQSLTEVARSIGCEVTLWKAHEGDGWVPDVDALERHIRPNTRCVVVNTPHNPTGYHMSRQMLCRIHDLAHTNGITLFCDEVYRGSEYRAADHLPAACDLGGRAVSLGVMSKSYGLAGLRIGWVATHDAAIVARMAALKDYTTICNSAPSEFLAELALRHKEKLAARNVGIITENLVVLDDFFQRHASQFQWQRPRAGSIAFPRLLGQDVTAFCDDLVRAASVLLLPGTLYDDHDNHFRIGFGRKNLPQAVARLEQFLQDPSTECGGPT